MAMLVIILCFFLLPVIMLIVGMVSRSHPKKEINGTVGYRSKRSKASQEAWDYAQELMAKYIIVGMGVDLAIGIVGALISLAVKDVSIAGVLMSVIMIIQIIPLIAMIPLIEGKLKERFGD